MAAASYTTDLTLIHACDAASASWTEPAAFAGGAITLPETDYFIQNTGCLSKNCGTTTPIGVGAIYNYGSAATIPSPGAFMIWLFFGAPNTLDTQANGGLRVFCGSATTAYNQFYVRGSNTYEYGGWICIPVDPTVTPDATVGAPTTTRQYFGAAAQIPGANIASKGNPFGIDILRFGRCEARMNGGDLANGYATFNGFSATNDSLTNRWGLIQSVQGGYLAQGLIVLGYTSAVDFRDSNKSIFIANTEKVASGFNAIEIRQATSRVDFTNITFTALGTVSRGNFITTNPATTNITSCSFTDMGTFGFLSGSTSIGTTFRRCNLITQSGSTFTSCIIDSTNDATRAMLVNDPGKITYCTFNSSGTKHAIEITATGTTSFVGNVFNGYASGVSGTTGNEAIYNNSGGLVTLNVSGGATPSYRNGTNATTVINSTVTTTFTGLKDNTEVRVYASGTTTELAGVENATDGTTNNRSFSFGLSAGTVVDYRIHNLDYEIIEVYGYTIASTATALPIQQRTDRWYTNPA
jgi:hypothetical protein